MYRDVNEQLSSFAALADAPADVFVCECSDVGCSKPISVSLPEYEDVRRFPTRFIVAHGHERPEEERIVFDTYEFTVVEKTGVGALIALRLDPRKQTRKSRSAWSDQRAAPGRAT